MSNKRLYINMRFEVFTAVKIGIESLWVVTSCSAVVGHQLSEDHAASIIRVFWVVTPCSDVEGYHCFGGPCCFHL
jgi:hypothetical protein